MSRSNFIFTPLNLFCAAQGAGHSLPSAPTPPVHQSQILVAMVVSPSALPMRPQDLFPPPNFESIVSLIQEALVRAVANGLTDRQLTARDFADRRADRRPRRRPRADALALSRRCCVAALLPRSLAPSCLAPLAPSRSRWCKSRGPPSSAPPLSLCPLQQPRCPALGDEASHGRRRGRHGSLKSITASQDADALCREWPTHRFASDSDGCLKHV